MAHSTQFQEVPQVPYSVTRSFTSFPSIRFDLYGSPGVSLGRALRNELGDLQHPDYTPVLTNTAKKVTLRINWPGYLPWCDVLHVFDHCYDAHPATLARLAHLVAKKIKTCLDDLNTDANRQRATNPNWLVETINIEDLVLVRLDHVARGSWQPVIACRINGIRR